MKTLFVAFQGDPMCFVHVLLNALDMHKKGIAVEIMIEGSATQLIAELADPAKPFATLYQQVKDKQLITAVCRACASKMGTLDAAQEQGLPINGEMSGHPPLANYIQDGYEIVTF